MLIARPFRTLLINFSKVQRWDTILQGFHRRWRSSAAEICNPFIDESIWTEAAADITLLRGGRTKDGRQLYTDQTSFGDKLQLI